jgi:hypothetical protein
MTRSAVSSVFGVLFRHSNDIRLSSRGAMKAAFAETFPLSPFDVIAERRERQVREYRRTF